VESQVEKAPEQSLLLVYKVFIVHGTGQHIFVIDTQSNAFTATRKRYQNIGENGKSDRNSARMSDASWYSA